MGSRLVTRRAGGTGPLVARVKGIVAGVAESVARAVAALGKAGGQAKVLGGPKPEGSGLAALGVGLS